MNYLEFTKSDYTIHNRLKLDVYLVQLCKLIILGKKTDSRKYGMVAACILDPQNRVVYGLNTIDSNNNTRRHAERVAMNRYIRQYGDIPKGSIIVTTLSPCNENSGYMADHRHGDSCTDIINHSMVRKVYCGYMDPSQGNNHSRYNLEETGNQNIVILCKKFADTFLHMT